MVSADCARDRWIGDWLLTSLHNPEYAEHMEGGSAQSCLLWQVPILVYKGARPDTVLHSARTTEKRSVFQGTILRRATAVNPRLRPQSVV